MPFFFFPAVAYVLCNGTRDAQVEDAVVVVVVAESTVLREHGRTDMARSKFGACFVT
jgi:hypothetical protein